MRKPNTAWENLQKSWENMKMWKTWGNLSKFEKTWQIKPENTSTNIIFDGITYEYWTLLYELYYDADRQKAEMLD